MWRHPGQRILMLFRRSLRSVSRRFARRKDARERHCPQMNLPSRGLPVSKIRGKRHSGQIPRCLSGIMDYVSLLARRRLVCFRSKQPPTVLQSCSPLAFCALARVRAAYCVSIYGRTAHDSPHRAGRRAARILCHSTARRSRAQEFQTWTGLRFALLSTVI